MVRVFKDNESRNAFLNNVNGVTQNISMTLIGSFAGLFIKKLNASNTLVSMLNSLPAFFSVIAILLGAGFATKCKNKRAVASLLYFSTRFIYFLMVGVAFISDKYKALYFVILYGLLHFPFSIGNFMWQSLFADIFKPTSRAKYLSVRSTLATIAGTITALLSGIYLSKISSSTNFIKNYQIIFFIAFIAGIFEVVSLYMHRENKDNSHAEIVTRDNPLSLKFIKIMLKEKQYILYMICIIIFHFAWQMGWPVFLTYDVDVLHTNEMWSAISLTISGISTAIGYTFWKRFSDKRGHLLTLSIGALGMATTPFYYAFITHISQAAIFSSITGFMQAALFFSSLNALYEVAPRENRTTYIAFSNLSTNVTLIIAPWVGMRIANILSFRNTFLLFTLFRLSAASLFLVFRAKQKRAFMPREVV